MNLSKKLAVVAFSTVLSSSVFAAKIVVLDGLLAVGQTKAADAFQKSLEKKLKAKKNDLVDLQNKLKAAQEKIKKNKDLVKASKLKSMKVQFEKIYVEYQRKAQEFEKIRVGEQQVFLNKMRPKVDKVLNKLVKDEGYDVVLSNQSVSYVKSNLNITNKITELLDKQK